MKISTKGRYALRLMLDIAMNSTVNPVPLKDTAERQSISVKYLEQIISNTRIGRKGDTVLQKPRLIIRWG